MFRLNPRIFRQEFWKPDGKSYSVKREKDFSRVFIFLPKACMGGLTMSGGGVGRQGLCVCASNYKERKVRGRVIGVSILLTLWKKYFDQDKMF